MITLETRKELVQVLIDITAVMSAPTDSDEEEAAIYEFFESAKKFVKAFRKHEFNGSGKLDKNGREIFEGDRIRTSETTGFVISYNDEFFIEYDNLKGANENPLNDLKSCELEIIDD